MANIQITQELVKEYFYYEDGFLFDKKTNKKQGRIQPKGYLTMTIAGRSRLVHRIIFLYHHGYFPLCTDHIDRDKTNNKIENLRSCTIQENNRNRTAKKNKASKYLGVIRHNNKWDTSVSFNGKTRNLGMCETEIEAAIQYNNFATKHYGEFANLNIIS